MRGVNIDVKPLFASAFTILISLLLQVDVIAQTIIQGQVLDDSNGDPLIGATVLIQETGEGEITDFDGKFSLNTAADFPLRLVINFMGYSEESLTLSSYSEPLVIRLQEGGLILETINVKGQRLSEERKKEPLSMETLDLLAIKETPSVSFYEGQIGRAHV